MVRHQHRLQLHHALGLFLVEARRNRDLVDGGGFEVRNDLPGRFERDHIVWQVGLDQHQRAVVAEFAWRAAGSQHHVVLAWLERGLDVGIRGLDRGELHVGMVFIAADRGQHIAGHRLRDAAEIERCERV